MISLKPAFTSTEDQSNKSGSEPEQLDSIQHFRDSVAKNPHDHQLAANFAAALLKSQHYQESINEADRVLALDPSFAEAYYIEAIAKLFLDQHQDALNAINKAIELNSGEKTVLKECDNVKQCAEIKKEKEDSELLNKSVQSNPDQNALMELEIDELSSPLQTRSKSVGFNPDTLDGAILYIDKKIVENPDDYTHYNSKASLLIQKRDPHAALKVCEEALHIGQKYNISKELIARIYAKKGHCHMAIGDYDKAVICFKRAVAHFGSEGLSLEEPAAHPLSRTQSETTANRMRRQASDKCLDIS